MIGFQIGVERLKMIPMDAQDPVAERIDYLLVEDDTVKRCSRLIQGTGYSNGLYSQLQFLTCRCALLPIRLLPALAHPLRSRRVSE